jgi:hypothetical protein
LKGWGGMDAGAFDSDHASSLQTNDGGVNIGLGTGTEGVV